MKENRPSGRRALMLAAGMGTRFKSEIPKVLHPLCGKPMASHLLDRLDEIGLEETLIVVGHGADQVQQALAAPRRRFVLQEPQLGTGHAVLTAAPHLKSGQGSLLIVYGDTPLVRKRTLQRLFSQREEDQAALTLITCEMQDPTGYGRIIRDSAGEISHIVEERDASAREKRISEVNPGIYCFDLQALLPAMSLLSNENAQQEFLLTDLPKLIRQRGGRVTTLAADSQQTRGINDRLQLSQAEGELRLQIAQRWMKQGVTILQPGSVIIDETVRLGADTTLYPGVILEGQTRIGRKCTIYGQSHIQDAWLADGVIVDQGSVIRQSRIGSGTRVGPYAHLRNGAEVGSECRVGNFVEVKKSTLGDRTKAAHLTYLGDAIIGNDVNIGAGTITCNYDGEKKHPTVMDDGVFIGSNCELIAPVRVGRGAYVAAGSSITEDVPPLALAIARGRQVNKPGWVSRKKEKK